MISFIIKGPPVVSSLFRGNKSKLFRLIVIKYWLSKGVGETKCSSFEREQLITD